MGVGAVFGALNTMYSAISTRTTEIATLRTAYAQLIFDISVTLRLAGIGVALASLIGFIGGLFPAIRAARLPIATALRAV